MTRPASLTARLVITTVALVALVAVLIGTATTLAMRSHLTDQLDADITSSIAHLTDEPGAGSPPGADDRFTGRNQGPGTLNAFFGSDSTAGMVLTGTPGDERTLSAAALEALDDVPTDGEVHEVDLPGFGSYRVTTVEVTLVTAGDTDDGVLVTGLPTRDVDDAVTSLVQWEILLGFLAVLTAGGAGMLVVRRQLRPLNEVAATAHRVAEQPLASGEIALTDRVPEHLTDERTEVGQVGAALNTLLAHVESSLAARHRSEQQVRQFVGDASHELRTPLATIKGYAELARRRPGDSETVLTALDKVEAESGRMTTLVEDLLLLARLDSGRPLAMESVDLTRLVVEAVADAQVLGPEHTWQLDLPDEGTEVVEVSGDAQRIHQVVTNLLTNARKYTPTGTTVTTRVRPGEISICDDGPGFPPALAGEAFERFVRGDAARNREGGVGLGLSLVKAIIEAHGGTVELASRPGDTRITVRFPAHR